MEKCQVFEYVKPLHSIPDNLNDFPDEYIQKNAKLGDIIWRDGYRDMDTLIIGENGILIKNPNACKDGELTIPKCIYSNIKDYQSFYQLEELASINFE